MIVDCFSFFNELDLLEIRLNSLAPYVDRFVLSECPVTHSGKPKPLYFSENRDRYKDFNITHLVVDNYERFLKSSPWILERYQRQYLMKGISDVSGDDIILVSDLDEIPNLDSYIIGEEGVFMQKLYYYYLNTFTGIEWKGSVARLRKDVGNMSRTRDWKNSTPLRIQNGGWHFSTLGPPDNIKTKIESFAHQEFNKDGIKEGIENSVKNLVDPYGRTSTKYTVEMPSGPKWLLENKDRYSHLFYEG